MYQIGDFFWEHVWAGESVIDGGSLVYARTTFAELMETISQISLHIYFVGVFAPSQVKRTVRYIKVA
jgi:hypothetical protein